MVSEILVSPEVQKLLILRKLGKHDVGSLAHRDYEAASGAG